VTASNPEFVESVIDPYKFTLDGTKVMFWQDRIAQWKRGEKFAPITMDVAWTRKCNAACEFCYAMTQASEGGTITQADAYGFLEDAAEIGVKGVSLISDGESTIVPWYADSIEYAGKLGIKIGVSTNGVRLTKKVLERILPHLAYLRWNFSGADVKRYKEIMGLHDRDYHRVVQNLKDCMAIVRRDRLNCIVDVQMVTMPKNHDQIVPLAKLCRDELHPHYLIFKHTADTVEGLLGVDYREYDKCYASFKEAEAMSTPEFRVVVKWSRLKDDGKRDYQRCMGPPFILQMSGNGLIAPCGFMFNRKFAKYHVGYICDRVEDGKLIKGQRFKDMWNSERYWDVMRDLSSTFDAQKSCGPNCLQTLANSWLDKYDKGEVQLPPPDAQRPPNLEFI
jgi:MoaA/NifB/PqqE/SkfB family radical SAM enzyme